MYIYIIRSESEKQRTELFVSFVTFTEYLLNG